MKVKSRAGRKRLLSHDEELVVSALALIDPENGRDAYTISELHDLVTHSIKPVGRTTIWDIRTRNPFPMDKDPSDIINGFDENWAISER